MNVSSGHCFLVATAILAGCTTQVRVTPVSPSQGSVHASHRLRELWWKNDPRCEDLVRRHGWQRLMQRDPELALQQLCEAASTNSTADAVAALAEVTRCYARELERTKPASATGAYLLAASLAYGQIEVGTGLSSTNPWNSPVVQTYNQAVARVVTLVQPLAATLQSNPVFSACHSSFRVDAQPGDPESGIPYYEQWLPADRWKQTGLRHRYRSDGLGARLIAMRTNQLTTPFEKHLPDEGIFRPSTAVLSFEPAGGDPSGRLQTARLVFYNPKCTSEIAVGGRQWPLAADYTMPGAMLLSRTRALFETRWTALVRPGETSRPHRLYLFEPYSPDRIPIIMVHGLHSTPLVWQQLTNELLGDPEVGRRYQIWHYLYPTGLPFLTSAADFRDEIESVRQLVDPSGHDFATQHMIVIAHSMGGLLARTLITDSDDTIWDSTFAVPFSQLDPNSRQLSQLRRVFFFHPKPYIKRVIFIAVPHRGSKTADGLVGRIVSRRVSLPNAMNLLIAGLKESMPGLLRPEAAPLFDRGYPNSIRALSPKAPVLMALAKLPVNAGTPFHSIIGDRGLGGGENSSDGVVSYSSSHLAGAGSELIVPTGHRSYDHPQAFGEVKRILALHAAELDGVSRRNPLVKEASR